jgi:FkbM family methyltransferase
MRHIVSMLYQIARKRKSGRFYLMSAYLKIIRQAQLYHKVYRHSETQPGAHFTIELLGMRISFFNYATLIHLFEEIFIREIYFFESDAPSPTIIDCGSHVGLSILYFKKRFPGCRVSGFEPDWLTFNLLKKNIVDNSVDGVNLKNVALTSVAGDGILYKTPHADSVNYSLIKTEKHREGQSVQTNLLSNFIYDKIDFLKIDAEGAEDRIIANLCNSGKIQLVDQIFLKYHPQCETSIFDLELLLVQHGFQKVWHENLKECKQMIFRKKSQTQEQVN